jgi:hypothetical protein
VHKESRAKVCLEMKSEAMVRVDKAGHLCPGQVQRGFFPPHLQMGTSLKSRDKLIRQLSET